MIVKFWGTRSLIPLAASLPRKYGGHTACVSIGTADAIHLILDCGTGAVPLGAAQETAAAPVLFLFISKYSWDRIQGLPFFSPLFRCDCKAVFYAVSADKDNIENLLKTQMRYEFFPVSFSSLPCKYLFHNITCPPGEQQTIPESKKFPGSMSVIKLHSISPISACKYNFQNQSLAYAVHINWERPYPQLEQLAAFLSGLDLLITNLPITKSAWLNFWRIQQLSQPKLTVFSDFPPQLSDASITALLQNAQEQLPQHNIQGTIQASYTDLQITI